MGMIAICSLLGKADIMNDRLTHADSQGVLKDIFERFASHRGKLWHEAVRRFLVGSNTEFYMVEIGKWGTSRNLLEAFSHAGFSVSPVGGNADRALRKSNPKQCYGERECFRMIPVRAMDFESTKNVDHKSVASRVQHVGLIAGCVSTSWEAACALLLETVEEKEGFNRRRPLLGLSPSPVVWTFVGGNTESRMSLANHGVKETPQLVGLISSDAGLGFKGIAEADYLYHRLGREQGTILPSDIFVFSIEPKDR